MRSLLVVLLVVGPLSGSVAGTFGPDVQMILLQLVFGTALSVVQLALLMMVGAVCVAPLWIALKILERKK
jgi:hypothetical protein